MQFYLRSYSPDPKFDNDPRLCPLSTETFNGLPSAFICVAEYDPVRSDGEQYHQKLQASNVPSSLYLGKGLVHGCIRMFRYCDEGRQFYLALIGSIANMLKKN